MMTNEFERSAVAVQGLYEVKPLTGENGLFAPLLKHFLESALEPSHRSGEMDDHLAQTRPPEQNHRNSKTTKQVKSNAGTFELQTPHDRTAPATSYQPQIVPKRKEVVLTPQLEQKVLSLYSVGNSYADISQHLSEMYGYSGSVSQPTKWLSRRRAEDLP